MTNIIRKMFFKNNTNSKENRWNLNINFSVFTKKKPPHTSEIGVNDKKMRYHTVG